MESTPRQVRKSANSTHVAASRTPQNEQLRWYSDGNIINIEAGSFMSNESTPGPGATPESNESFEKIFAEYEQSHSRQAGEAGRQIEGTVVAVSADSVFVDIGYKTEGVLPLGAFQSAGESI